MKLNELLTRIGIMSSDQREIDRITRNIEECDEKSVFVAIQGTHFDTHVYIEEARGMGAYVISNLVMGGDSEVVDTRKIYGILCLALHGNAHQFLTIIGVSGTNGKSSVSHAIYQGLSVTGTKCCLCSTDGIYTEDQILTTYNTTPSIDILSDILQECIKRKITHVIMEVSSHSLAQYRISGLQFDCLVYTNLGHDHLDYHPSFMAYKDAKEMGKGYLKEDGFIVLSQDPLIQMMRTSMYLCIDCGKGEYSYSYEWNENGCVLYYQQQEFELPIYFDFEVDNLMLAITALSMFIPKKEIYQYLDLYRPLSGRGEIIYNKEYTIIVDYAHTLEAYEALGRNVERLGRESWIVFGLGGERDISKRAMIGRSVSEYFDHIVLTSDNPRGEDPYRICQMIASGSEKATEIIIERAEAIEYAILNAMKHDIIIVAGKGNEDKIFVGSESIYFKDKDVILQLLVKRGLLYDI